MADAIRLAGPAGAAEVLDIAEARPAWHADAACREHPELNWLPEHGDHAGEQLAVCRGCLVLEECRAWALGQSVNLVGIWGATTARQRRVIRRTG